MPDITVSKQARQDLVDIWLYIADNNPYAADTLLDRPHEKISYLADHPLLGRRDRTSLPTSGISSRAIT